jgi:hypothetical protein
MENNKEKHQWKNINAKKFNSVAYLLHSSPQRTLLFSRTAAVAATSTTSTRTQATTATTTATATSVAASSGGARVGVGGQAHAGHKPVWSRVHDEFNLKKQSS